MAGQDTPSILTALEAALKKAPAADQDAATVALAKRYAAELDHAQVLIAEAAALIEDLDPEDTGVRQRIAKLAAEVDATKVAALIGPKLLDTLAALQLTPVARRAAVPPGGGGGNGDRSSSALGQLRALGSNRTKAVDASA